MYQTVIINYMQLNSLIAGMDVPWPDALGHIFNAQSVMSTIGEHLISPDCELKTINAADLAYGKQIFFSVLPWALSFMSYFTWKAIAYVYGRNLLSGGSMIERHLC